jgi:hypothetical protein
VIATKVFNALKEDFSAQGLDHNTHILLFSDLHENDPSTLSFESGPLADPLQLGTVIRDEGKRMKLEGLMQNVVKCPSLNGAHVSVYFPPTDPGPRSKRMPLLFRLWSELFREHGASTVEAVY